MTIEENLIGAGVSEIPSVETELAIKSEEPANKIAKAKKLRSNRSVADVVTVELASKRRRYTEAERSELLKDIQTKIGGGATLKAAVQSVGVTEQSYYQWKRAEKTGQSVAPTSDDIAFADLDKLEAENQRLRTLLGQQLRAENEKLRKRLSDAG